MTQHLERLVQPGAEVLDFGSGAGIFALVAALRGGRVLAVDCSHQMLLAGARKGAAMRELVSAGTPGTAPGVITRVAGSLDCLSPRARFDVITAVAVLEYMEEQPDAVRDMYDRLKAGGHLLLTCPRPQSVVRRVERPLDAAAVALGRLTGRARFSDRAYATLRPRGSHVDWSSRLPAGVFVQRFVLPLGHDRLRRRFSPNEVVIVRKPTQAST